MIRITGLPIIKIIVDVEGLDYAMNNYSDYPEVLDEKFHELRDKYLAARKDLEDYIKEA